MKKILFLLAAMSGFFIAQNSYATCSNYKTFSDGSTLTAAELNSLQTNYTNCINGLLDGDTFTGDILLYSGSDIIFYSDTGTTKTAEILGNNGNLSLYQSGDFGIYSGASTLKFFVDGATGNFGIPSGQRFFVDGTSLAGNTYIEESSADLMGLVAGGTRRLGIGSGVGIVANSNFYWDGTGLTGNTYTVESANDQLDTIVGGTTLLRLTTTAVTIPSNTRLRWDGSTTGDTYTEESGANQLDTTVGGTLAMRIDSSADILFPSHDTTASGANAYIDAATGELMRSTSSRQYKENIEDIEIDTSKVYDLRPVSYDDKNRNLKESTDATLSHQRYFGLIAEEVDEVIPQLVDHNSSTGEAEYVYYDRLSVLILAELKKLKAENEDLKARLTAAGF